MGRIDLRYADQTGFNLLPNVPYGWIRVGHQQPEERHAQHLRAAQPARRSDQLPDCGLRQLADGHRLAR
jgi:hypothetical protein